MREFAFFVAGWNGCLALSSLSDGNGWKVAAFTLAFILCLVIGFANRARELA